MKIRNHCIFTILGLVSCFISQAQTSLDTLSKTIEMEQVVVTGTRTPKLLLNTPVATKVITASDISKSDATNLRDVLQQVLPGVEFSYAMNQQTHLNFSGFGGQSMLILVDGERLAGENMDNVDFSRIGMDNVERIEIVKGAVSALYGSNATGGVINIITKKKTQPFALNVNARWGKHKEQRYGTTLQLGQNKLSNLLTIHRTSVDNYKVKNGNQPISRVIETIYGDATWNFKNQLSYTPIHNLTFIGRAGYYFRQLVRSAEVPERYRAFSGGLRAIWDITPHQNVEIGYSFDQYDKSDYLKRAGLDIRDYSNVQNALRVLYNHQLPNGDVFTAGTDFLHDYIYNVNLDGNTKKQNAYDVFTQYDWTITPQWEAVAALRYDYFSDQKNSRLTPKLNVRYQPLTNLNLRLGYGMGFRSPSLKEKYYNFDMAGIWQVEGNADLKAEVSHNFNASIDYTRFRCNFTIAGYYNRVKNKIATGTPYYENPTDRIPKLPYINISDYSVYGGEATIQTKLQNGITARLSYAYTNEQLPKDNNGNDFAAQYMPARKHSLTVHADWEYSFSKHYAVNIGIDGRWLSATQNLEYVGYYNISQGLHLVDYPAYTIWKLMVNQRFGKAVSVNISLDNLFNYKPKYYYLNSPLTDGINLLVGVSVDIEKLF